MILTCSPFAFHVVELDIAHFGEGNSANWHAEFDMVVRNTYRCTVYSVYIYIWVFIDDIAI